MTEPMERVEDRILTIRGHRVMVDTDLAEVYGVPTKALNQAIKRNAERFPGDFMFQLSREEADSLRSQTVTLNTVRGQHRKYLPYVFTEHGAIMAASVLNSSRAIEASVYVVRAFVKMREAMSSDRELARRLDALEKKYAAHDVRITGIFDAIRALMEPPTKPPGGSVIDRGRSHFRPRRHGTCVPPDGNRFPGEYRPMTVPMERVENRILGIRGLHRRGFLLNLYNI